MSCSDLPYSSERRAAQRIPGGAARDADGRGGRDPLRVAIRPGTGAGPPLLLANGIGASLEGFQPFVDALDPAIEVIRFDVPGVRGSSLPARPYRFATLAWLLRGLLDKLATGPPTSSASPGAAGWPSSRAVQPAPVRRLILVATATGPQTMVPGDPLVLAKMLAQRQHQDAGYPRRIAGELYGGAREQTGHDRGFLRQSRPGPLRGYLYRAPPGSGRPRCRSCRSSASQRWCSRATTTRSSRWPTPDPGRADPQRAAACLPRQPPRAGDPP